MCVEALHAVNTHVEYVVVIVAPYENQIRLIFNRLQELINGSPLVKARMLGSTKNPYEIKFQNNSRIVGFTTGASSNSGGASIRGQRANLIICDEMDYLGDGDFENISMLAAERNDIRIICSSTPTGKRGAFYTICMDKNAGYSEHVHPSTHNPNWGPEMEAEFRAELTDLAYTHEVLADFGTQDTGVFNKDDLDFCARIDNYAYDELTRAQLIRLEKSGAEPPVMYLPIGNRFKPNLFRTMGVDWDKYSASSSIIILDFEPDVNKFRVVRRIEVPKAEYSYDTAVNLIIQLNEIYNPSWIYVDRGAGEYQIERLHIIGEENPATGLKLKVKGFQFSNKIEVPDPVKKTVTNEPLKPFMVNQLTMAIERHRLIISPYDEVLKKQLVDYEVERISANGQPVFTSVNEHFVDALGLAYLAMVLEFAEITQGIKTLEFSSRMTQINANLPERRAQYDLLGMANAAQIKTPWGNVKVDYNDLPGDRQTYYKVPINKLKETVSGGGIGWGSRSGSRRGPSNRRAF